MGTLKQAQIWLLFYEDTLVIFTTQTTTTTTKPLLKFVLENKAAKQVSDSVLLLASQEKTRNDNKIFKPFAVEASKSRQQHFRGDTA